MKYKIIFAFAILILAGACNKGVKRNLISLNGSWQFCIDSLNTGEKDKWFEAGLPKAQEVKVPHTWSSAEKKGHSLKGKGWYEKKIFIPTEYKNKLMRIQFDAVYHDAIIWVNGIQAGKHIGSGYTRFYIDATELLKPGEENRITVLSDNSFSRECVPFISSYDWANDGGIIRSVNLIVTEKTAVEKVLVYGEPVIKSPGEGIAHVTISVLGKNGSNQQKVTVSATISDLKSNKPIWKGEVEPSNGLTFKKSIHLTGVQWWHFDDPNLYKIKVLVSVDGKEMDEYESRFGFRSIAADQHHFYLNGEPIRLMGLEWMPGSTMITGTAESSEDLKKNLELMKNVNCIYTRFHWQQDEFVFNWCDEHGILIQEEIPYWGGLTMINDTLLGLGKMQLNEMVNDHFNHPSIITWGIGNELASRDTLNIRSLKILYQYAKDLDSSRLVNYVSNRVHQTIKNKKDTTHDATELGDVMMFNEYYSTWYGQSVDVVGGELDRIHSEYPSKALVISEWGLCEPVHKGGDPRRCKEMKQQKAIYDSRPYVAGAIYFCLNDYRTHMGEDFTYDYPQRVHGVVDINLKTKPSYDTLKALSAPIAITGIRRSGDSVYVIVKGSTGLPSYTVRNYQLSIGKETAIIPALKPGEEITMAIATKNSDEKIIVKRPTGFTVIEI